MRGRLEVAVWLRSEEESVPCSLALAWTNDVGGSVQLGVGEGYFPIALENSGDTCSNGLGYRACQEKG